MPGAAAALTAPGAGVDILTGLALVAAGAYARRRWLLVAGVVWLAGDVWSALAYAHRGPLVHALLGLSPVTVLAWADGLIPAVAASPWITLALVAAVVGATARQRRGLATAAAAVVGGALVLEAVGQLAGADVAAAAAWWYDLALIGVAAGVALAPRSAGTAELVVELAAEPRALRATLARALGDPTLDVVYRVDDAWVDEAGHTVGLPAPGTRAMRVIDDMAALIHDPLALQDDALGRSVDAAVRLALVNVRLQAEVAARVDEVERSRRRLVEAGDAERRRLGEQMRAGADGHLAAAAAELATVPAAGPLRDQLVAAQADLRRFAQGIHPPALAESGLAGALRELGVAADVDVPMTRFPPASETAAYFVCLEALANVAKYAPAAHVRIQVSEAGHRLRVRVTDDGPGGAAPGRGSGLRGLADRVEALGGRLSIRSPAGLGTSVEAELPLREAPHGAET